MNDSGKSSTGDQTPPSDSKNVIKEPAVAENSGIADVTPQEANENTTNTEIFQKTDQNLPKKEDFLSSAQNPPQNVINPESIVSSHSASGSGKGFNMFLILGIIIIAVVWGGVAYLFIQNRNLKGSGSNGDNSEQVVQATSPTPVFSPEQIKMINGNIVQEKSNGETKVLVDKTDYVGTGITGFIKVNVSPDNNKLCFESLSPAPDPAIYISDVDGQNVIEMAVKKQNCVWAKDSGAVFYINTSSKTSPVNIFKYDINTMTESDLTSSSVPSGLIRRYEIVGLSADGSKIICKYENIGGAATTETSTECEIDLETGEIRSL